MTSIHKQEKEQFKKVFQDNFLDNFEDRYKILEVFLQTEQHVTVNELTVLLQEKGLTYEPHFVDDTLKFMCRFGFAQTNRFEDGKLRYEHWHLGDHHDHMICTKCKNVIEFHNEEIEKLQLKVATSYHFYMLQHRMEIYGICSACLADRKQLKPLATAKPGEKLRIKALSGGKGMQMHLLAMGLRIEDPIMVITNNDQGQLVVALDQKRYVLGREMAHKILVQIDDN